MISSLMRYLGCSYKELLHVIPWTVIQGMIATIPKTESKTINKNSDNEPVNFFDFGAKLVNFKHGND